MAASSQLGIKQLLEAEGKAQEIVNKARKDKVALIKQAHDEAEKEVAEYRAKRNKEFEAFSRTHLSGTDMYTKQLAVQTDEQISKASIDIKSHAEEVIDFLLKVVADVKTDYTVETR